MVNFIQLNKQIYDKFILRSNRNNNEIIKHVSHHYKTTSLDFYTFNFILKLGPPQENIYTNLNDDFFKALSDHKFKIHFLGIANGDTLTYTPTHLIYTYPYKKMGIYVNKKIKKELSIRGITLKNPPKNNPHDKIVSVFMF